MRDLTIGISIRISLNAPSPTSSLDLDLELGSNPDRAPTTGGEDQGHVPFASLPFADETSRLEAIAVLSSMMSGETAAAAGAVAGEASDDNVADAQPPHSSASTFPSRELWQSRPRTLYVEILDVFFDICDETLNKVNSIWSGVDPMSLANCVSVLIFSGIKLSNIILRGRISCFSAN